MEIMYLHLIIWGLSIRKKENFQKAGDWYLKAAVKNNAYGAYNLGNLFLNDKYSKKNIDSTNYWHRKGSKLGPRRISSSTRL